MMNANAIIMGGGSGTRFWPKSTCKKPKQFLTLCGNKSMLRTTVDRLLPLIHHEDIYFIGNKSHYALVRKELFDIPASNIISEPVGRNTAPCLGLAAVYLKKKNKDSVAIAVPSDHIISKNKTFHKIVKKSMKLAQKKDVFVTIGIPPSSPHTGFGYIQRSSSVNGAEGFFNVKRFVEKPDLDKAISYVKSGDYLWNSGMFIFNVNTMLDAFKSHLPEMYFLLMEVYRDLGTKKEKYTLNRIFPQMESISIDYGIMEKVSNVILIEGDIGWSDVGSWLALSEVAKKDKEKNVFVGDVVLRNSSNNIVYSDDLLVAMIDVHDLIVVQSGKSVLIAQKGSSEKVKDIVETLKRQNKTEYI